MMPNFLQPYETTSYTKMISARQRELARLRIMQFPEHYPKMSMIPESQVYDSQRVIRAPAQGSTTNRDTKRVFYGSG